MNEINKTAGSLKIIYEGLGVFGFYINKIRKTNMVKIILIPYIFSLI